MTLASRPLPVDVQSVCYKKMLASLEKIGFGTREHNVWQTPRYMHIVGIYLCTRVWGLAHGELCFACLGCMHEA